MANKNICDVDLLQSMSKNTNVIVDENGKVNKLNLYNEFNTVNTKIDDNVNTLSNNIAQLSNPNLLINGDFQVWQRGTSFNNVANQYVVDRWKLANAKANTTLVERSTDVPSGQPFNYSIHIKEDTNGNSYLVQHFETPPKGVVTLSFWYKSTTGISSYIIDAEQELHLLDIPASNVWTKITKTFEVTSLQRIEIIHYLPIGECYMTGIKLEQGSIATPFVPRLYAEELALCKRYYQVISSLYLYCNEYTGSISYFNGIVLATPMRTIPTATFNEGSAIFQNNKEISYFKVSGQKTGMYFTGFLDAEIY